MTTSRIVAGASDPISIPSAATLLPSDLLWAAFLKTDGQAWVGVDRLLPSAAQVDLGFLLDRAIVLPKGTQANRDILPWVGDTLTVAFLPTPNPQPGDLGFVPVTILPVTRPEDADRFLQNLQANHPRPSQTQDYKGVSLLTWEAKPKPQKQENSDVESGGVPELPFPYDVFGLNGAEAAIARLDGHLVAGNLQAVRLLVDGLGGKRLAANPMFLRSVRKPTWQLAIATGYGDYAQIGKVQEQVFGSSLDELTANVLGITKADYVRSIRVATADYSAFDSMLWVQPNGLRLQSSAYYTRPGTRFVPFAGLGTANTLLSRLPPNTYVSISSRNFQEQWRLLVREAERIPLYTVFANGLRTFTPLVLGLDFERDLVSWMDGEYAFVFFPARHGFLQSLGINAGIATLVQTSKPAAANAALRKIEAFARRTAGSGIAIARRSYAGKSFTSWEIGDPGNRKAKQSVFAYGWLDRHTLVVTTGLGTLSAFLPTPAKPLAASAAAAIAEMPAQNFGYFYANAGVLARMTYAALIESNADIKRPEVEATIAALGDLVMAYSADRDRIQADAFVGITPVKPERRQGERR